MHELPPILDKRDEHSNLLGAESEVAAAADKDETTNVIVAKSSLPFNSAIGWRKDPNGFVIEDGWWRGSCAFRQPADVMAANARAASGAAVSLA